MSPQVHFFKITPDIQLFRNNTPQVLAFPVTSKQIAWSACAAYVTCHTLNPPIKSIEYVGSKYIKDIAIEENEVPWSEALGWCDDPRVRS